MSDRLVARAVATKVWLEHGIRPNIVVDGQWPLVLEHLDNCMAELASE